MTTTQTPRTRRVPRFAARAQTILNAYPWPEGFTVTVQDLGYGLMPDVWLEGPGAGRANVRLDPYDLTSADPARVVPALVKQLRAHSRDPRYTEQSRRDDQSAAEALELSLTQPDTAACPCWDFDFRLGHEGHCCFLRDDRNRKIDNGFKAVEDICHAPALGVV